MAMAAMTYTTGLVVGRAFAMASGPLVTARAPEELHDLAEGDHEALTQARERFASFVLRDPGSVDDARALRLVEQALAIRTASR